MRRSAHHEAAREDSAVHAERAGPRERVDVQRERRFAVAAASDARDPGGEAAGRLASNDISWNARVRAIRAVRTAKTSIEYGVVAGRRGEA